ncbi:TetR/AcrR family transcriptional regulator [Paenibacillus physcomitrellae]|uniref:TetR family transcriptional regulator n=1 Tax=Paenibacillus physcomitrellae TaxID=1619311 RepID=A0ABQ1FVJ5_9BACL|nr:TetR family transcriptional regulator [Paenibacillus physcomitrellae]GGA31354.1 TetR family transcriptional regulator [Paenibacillus physcomitrellae]
MNKKSAVLTKTEILDAAETALRRYGPDKTSVTDVAKLLGVSHGTLYRHYDTKAALKEAVTERWLEQMISKPLEEIRAGAEVGAESESETEAYIPDRLKAYIKGLIKLKRDFSQHDAEMFKMYAEVTEASADLISEHISVLCGHLTSLIKTGMDKGQIRQGDPAKMAVALFQATVRFHHPAHAYEWVEAEIDDQFEQVWGMLEDGFRK